MQPETAFWLLSAMAQSAAALAGLSAVLLVFQLRIAFQGLANLEQDLDRTNQALTAKVWANLIRYSATATVVFLLAIGFSLGALWWVEPGDAAVGVHIVTLAIAGLSLLLIGGLMMTLFVREPGGWILPALDDMAKGMTSKKLRAELRRTQAEDRKGAAARRKSHPDQRDNETRLSNH